MTDRIGIGRVAAEDAGGGKFRCACGSVVMLALACLVLLAVAGGARAQERSVWVQIEARPTLSAAQERVRDAAGRLARVSGYALDTGWYGIVLGPYPESEARRLLADLVARQVIPADSFLEDGRQFQQQFYPSGTVPGLETQPVEVRVPQAMTTTVLPPAGEVPPAPAVGDAADAPALADPTTPAGPQPAAATIPDETPAEALAGESGLSQSERETIQVALGWAGFYDGGIDGAFGPGTRGAMESWQLANGHAATGVLTTRQRAELLTAWRAIVAGLGLETVRDDSVGIEMTVPLGVVAFDAYDPPFARFGPTEDFPARVLMISQRGDRNRLRGLYEVMQTLEIVPPMGPRALGENGFEIEGVDAEIHSYTFVELGDGRIKGFTLVWPAGDDERRARVLAEMKSSFTRLDGALDPGIAPPDADQAVDLVAGLAVRKPRLSRSGFFVDDAGAVLTTAEAVQGCGRITLDDEQEARVAHVDATQGLAVLRPLFPLAPLGVAAFQTAVPRLQSGVAVAGYPYGGLLVMPTLTFGQLADIRGLDGETGVKRLSLAASDGDAGGPVFDSGGAVLGMLLPRQAGGDKVLPPDVSFSRNAEAIVATLGVAGVTPRTTSAFLDTAPELLTRRAAEMTVLVSCWEQ